MANRKWTEDELVAVLRLYREIPFGKIHSKNPDVVELARKIDRSASAIALKMANFASLDPELERKGMENASALDRQVWSKFSK